MTTKKEDREASTAVTITASKDQKKNKPKKHVVMPQVDGKEIYEQDLVTLRINFTRLNLPENKKKGGDAAARAAPVHAPFFPKTLRESWWVVLTDKPPAGKRGGPGAHDVNIHAFERVVNQERDFKHELRFLAPQRAGDYEMELQIFSDCYMGLDQSSTIRFSVKPASELPEYQPHPEDLELDNEPTLFEQVRTCTHTLSIYLRVS